MTHEISPFETDITVDGIFLKFVVSEFWEMAAPAKVRVTRNGGRGTKQHYRVGEK